LSREEGGARMPHPPQARWRITVSLLTVGVSVWIRAVVTVPFGVSVSPRRWRIGCFGYRDSDMDTAVSIPRCGVGQHGERRSSRGSHGGRAKVKTMGMESVCHPPTVARNPHRAERLSRAVVTVRGSPAVRSSGFVPSRLQQDRHYTPWHRLGRRSAVPDVPKPSKTQGKTPLPPRE
jgi:hypothetical protein